MKVLPVIILSLFVSIGASAQYTFIYTDVVQMDSLPKSELYKRALYSIAKMYSSPKTVVQVADEQTGTLIVKAHFIPQIPNAMGGKTPNTGFINYVLTIICKDNKYKYTLDEVTHAGNYTLGSGGALTNEKPDCKPMEGISKSFWNNKMKPAADMGCRDMVDKLRKGMETKDMNSDF